MKLNNEYNFGVVPTVDTPRSRFLMHANRRTTFNAGRLIPIYVNPLIQPGDTLKVRATMVIRMTTPKFPTMDNLFADLRAFFIPHRLVWDGFKQFTGENETGAWTLSSEKTIPQICIYTNVDSNTKQKIQKGDSLQYMGLPIGYPAAITTPPSPANCTTKVMALPWRAYAKTWSDWYRDENFVPPLYINTGDNDVSYHYGTVSEWGKYAVNSVITNTCAPVYKFKDYFNACLPEPQKLTGGAVTLPIGQSAPIILSSYTNNQIVRKSDGGAINSATTGDHRDGLSSATISGIDGALRNNTGTSPDVYETAWLDPNGTLTADLSNAVAATINAQRMAFAVQRIGELNARAGTRFNEIINAFFKVKGNLSAVVQRSQYLGGFRLPLQMSQVLQNSSTDSVSPQGNTAAYSLTVDSQNLFTHSFEEWGTLLFCLCVRQEHSYSQGIQNFWSKKRKYDFYWPQLAFLGEQEIKTKEIFADGSSNDETTFGFNERWIEYRTEQNLNTGEMSPDYSQSLSTWHYGDDYSQAPVLSDAWRRETPDYIDRTLTVAHTQADQFFMDSRFDFDKTSAIPLRSIPGLLDHF